jgi:hypothetical protein
MSEKENENNILIGLHSPLRRPGESSRQSAKRVAREFFDGLLEIELRQENQRQPRPEARKGIA